MGQSYRVYAISSRWLLILVLMFQFHPKGQSVLAENPKSLLLPIRPITEGSAVDRYLSARPDDPTKFKSPDKSSLRGIDAVGSHPLNVNRTTLGVVTQAQFQFPTPGNSGGSDADFLNAEVEKSESEPEFTPNPFPESNLVQPLPSSGEIIDPELKGARELPTGGSSNIPSEWDKRLGQESYVPFDSTNLGEMYATMNNSTFVSPASNYSATTSWGKNALRPAGSVTPMTHTTDLPTINAPPNVQSRLTRVLSASDLAKYDAVPISPLFSFGQESNCVVVGQGFLGQPVAYVPGQWVRNTIRYLFP